MSELQSILETQEEERAAKLRSIVAKPAPIRPVNRTSKRVHAETVAGGIADTMDDASIDADALSKLLDVLEGNEGAVQVETEAPSGQETSKANAEFDLQAEMVQLLGLADSYNARRNLPLGNVDKRGVGAPHASDNGVDNYIGGDKDVLRNHLSNDDRTFTYEEDLSSLSNNDYSHDSSYNNDDGSYLDELYENGL
jgi:hypothetical protein